MSVSKPNYNFMENPGFFLCLICVIAVFIPTLFPDKSALASYVNKFILCFNRRQTLLDF